MPYEFNRDVTVTITLTARTAQILANWASLDRTIQGALTQDDVGLEELERLAPILDELHRLTRSQLWSCEDATYFKTRHQCRLEAASCKKTVDEVIEYTNSIGIEVRG